MKILQVPELRKLNNQEKLKSQVCELMTEMNFNRPLSYRAGLLEYNYDCAVLLKCQQNTISDDQTEHIRSLTAEAAIPNNFIIQSNTNCG